MTAYVAGDAVVLYASDKAQFSVWSAESPVTLAVSRAVEVDSSQVPSDRTLTVELVFSGNPGTFEIDVQEADTNEDAAFINTAINAIINAATVSSDGVTYRARATYVQWDARFARLRMVNDPANAVTVTAKFTVR